MAGRARRAATDLAAAEATLRDHALAKPLATEHFPWGERAIKVKGKVFLFMHADADELSLSTKLPRSSPVALMLPFAQPTGYGLGKAGWVSARFSAGDPPPVEMLCAWIDESYQAVAPAKLAAQAGAAPADPPDSLTHVRQPPPISSQHGGAATSARKPSPAAAASRRKPAPAAKRTHAAAAAAPRRKPRPKTAAATTASGRRSTARGKTSASGDRRLR